MVAAGNDTINNAGVIFQSRDAGNSWELVYQAPTDTLLNDMDGLTAVGNNGFIVRRPFSGSRNWSVWRPLTNRDLYAVAGDYIGGDSVYLEDRAGWEVIDSTQSWDALAAGRNYVYGRKGADIYSGFFDIPDRRMGYIPPVPLNPTALGRA